VDSTGSEDGPEVVRQDGQHDRVSPVDVEPGRVPARLPVLEDVPPLPILLARDVHVIRHDVQHQPHVVAAQRRGEAGERGRATELVADAAVIDDVVAVRRARRRLKDRARVEVAHAELGQVRDDGGRVIQREPGVELDAIRGARRRTVGSSHAPVGG
jgi:hypothetical protein